jgi:hypothetical protein
MFEQVRRALIIARLRHGLLPTPCFSAIYRDHALCVLLVAFRLGSVFLLTVTTNTRTSQRILASSCLLLPLCLQLVLAITCASYSCVLAASSMATFFFLSGYVKTGRPAVVRHMKSQKRTRQQRDGAVGSSAPQRWPTPYAPNGGRVSNIQHLHHMSSRCC